MQNETLILFVRVLIQVVDARGVERRRPTLDAMNFIALIQQELRQIGAVLTGNAGDKCFFQINIPFFCSWTLLNSVCNQQ